ncbi:MAG: hypothetical protein V2I33_23345 [Kangiellaceae bacterium]|jgi:hypothetical protein|nr:hypothetical protein [Kangiellaceae bacterium]
MYVNDPATNAQCRKVALRLVNHLAKHGWWIISPVYDLPVNPVPLFLAVFMKMGMVLDPATYAKHLEWYYEIWYELAAWFELGIRGKHVESEFPNNLAVISIQTLAMLETEPKKHATLVRAIKEHATTRGGDYLQSNWYGFYAAIDPENAFKNERVIGGLLGTLLDIPPGPKYDYFQNLTDRPDYEPHYSDSMSKYAIFPSDRKT